MRSHSLVTAVGILLSACGGAPAEEIGDETVALPLSAVPAATIGPVDRPTICVYCLLPQRIVEDIKPESIALDESMVYFTASAGLPGPRVLKVPLAGGAQTALVNRSAVNDSLALAGGALHYVLTGENDLTSVPVDGGAESVTFDLDGQAVTQRDALSVGSGATASSTHLYWASAYKSQLYDVHFWRFWGVSLVSKTALLPATVPSTGSFYYPYKVTSDDSRVYFTTDGGDLYSVPRVPLSPGVTTPTLLEAAPSSVGLVSVPLATDGVHVYYAIGGNIREISVSGGPSSVVATDVGAISALVLSEGALYFTNASAGTVKKQELGASTPVTLASAQLSPTPLAVNATHVYWGADNGLFRRNR